MVECLPNPGTYGPPLCGNKEDCWPSTYGTKPYQYYRQTCYSTSPLTVLHPMHTTSTPLKPINGASVLPRDKFCLVTSSWRHIPIQCHHSFVLYFVMTSWKSRLALLFSRLLHTYGTKPYQYCRHTCYPTPLLHFFLPWILSVHLLHLFMTSQYYLEKFCLFTSSWRHILIQCHYCIVFHFVIRSWKSRLALFSPLFHTAMVRDRIILPAHLLLHTSLTLVHPVNTTRTPFTPNRDVTVLI